MGYWAFSNLGFICDKENREEVKKLLECCGVNFAVQRGSETGSVNTAFLNVDCMGAYNRDFECAEIFYIANRLFNNTTILYEAEEGASDNGWYSRYEEVYDPKTARKLIGDVDYCYDGNEVFGESVYKQIKDECEEAAREKKIPIGWGYYYPEGDDFYDLCEGILERHGGLSSFGTRKSTEDIPSVEISQEAIAKLIENASNKGYKSLVEKIEKTSFN